MPTGWPRILDCRLFPLYSGLDENKPMSELCEEVQTACRTQILLRQMQVRGLEGNGAPVLLLRVPRQHNRPRTPEISQANTDRVSSLKVAVFGGRGLLRMQFPVGCKGGVDASGKKGLREGAFEAQVRASSEGAPVDRKRDRRFGAGSASVCQRASNFG